MSEFEDLATYLSRNKPVRDATLVSLAYVLACEDARTLLAVIRADLHDRGVELLDSQECDDDWFQLIGIKSGDPLPLP